MSQRRNTSGFRKYFELNENKNWTYQNLWDTPETVLREKCIAINVYIKKEERF